MSKVAVTLKLV